MSSEESLERIALALETIAGALTRQPSAEPANDVESKPKRKRRKLPRPTELDVARARKLAAEHPDLLTVER